MGALFLLKFQQESTETEYALLLKGLVDEGAYSSGTDWEIRKKNYLQALVLLDKAEKDKIEIESLIEGVAEDLGLPKTYQPALQVSLMRNLDIAQQYGLLTAENIANIESGDDLRISRGGYEGELAFVDNTVPHRYSPEIEMRFANLLIKPESIVRRYPDRISEGAVLVMNACRDAEWVSESSYDRTLSIVRRTGVGL